MFAILPLLHVWPILQSMVPNQFSCQLIKEPAPAMKTPVDFVAFHTRFKIIFFLMMLISSGCVTAPTKSDKMMPMDFSISYGYRGGSFLGSKNYVISLKAGQDGQISSGEKTALFPVEKEKLEKIFLMLVQQNFFAADPQGAGASPLMVVRLKQQLPSLFGIGGSHVQLHAQADRVLVDLPPLPLKVRESNIDYARILRIEHTRVEGLPADVTKEKLEQAVAETKGLTEVFEAIQALAPESAFKEVGL